MSAPAQIPSGGVVTWEIKVGKSTRGKLSALPDSVSVLSISINQAINRIASAKLVILDGSGAQEDFKVSASDFFVPGNPIQIKAGYDSKNKLVFSGIVTQQSIRLQGGNPSLEIVCKDKAVKMTIGRKNAVYTNMSDSTLIKKLIKNHSLSANVASTSSKFPEMVQYYTSDWDFMLTRAEVNGLIVATFHNKVAVFAPWKKTKPVFTIKFGENLYEINADLDAVTQVESTEAQAWDYQNQKIIQSKVPSNESSPGNLSSKTLAKNMGGKFPFTLQTTGPLPQADLKTWATTQMKRRDYAKIRGDVKFQGSALVAPGKYLTLAGVSARFNGDHFVSEVQHTLSRGEWFTTASLGLSPFWFVREPDVMAPPASGLLPGIQGLFNGVVTKIDKDPKKEYRVKVQIPLLGEKAEGLWARLANFYATANAGSFFFPEVGDEVVVGFLNEDPRFPVILGSLYSDQKHKPFKGLEPNKKNSKKAIVSKSGLQVSFNDEAKVLTFATPNENRLLLDDKNKKIFIKDGNGNSLLFSSSGITLKSSKTITLEASKGLNLKGNSGVTVKASGGDVNVSGTNIAAKANSKFSAKGSASAEVQGGAQLALKAGIVKLN